MTIHVTYYFNEENIHYITCSDPPAAATIMISTAVTLLCGHKLLSSGENAAPLTLDKFSLVCGLVAFCCLKKATCQQSAWPHLTLKLSHTHGHTEGLSTFSTHTVSVIGVNYVCQKLAKTLVHCCARHKIEPSVSLLEL